VAFRPFEKKDAKPIDFEALCIKMIIAALLCIGAVPWDALNYSPTSRELSPVAIYQRSASEDSASAAIFPFTLNGTGSYVVLDFGQNVAGFTTLSFGSATSGTNVGMAYSESTNYAVCPSSAVSACADGAEFAQELALGIKDNGALIKLDISRKKKGQAGAGDHSNGGKGPDGTLTAPAKANSQFTPTVAHMRGGFRYLNLFLEAGGNVEIKNVSLHFTAAPTMEDPSAYKGHFYSSDDLVNKIWYACAYTVQMCSIDPAHGRQVRGNSILSCTIYLRSTPSLRNSGALRNQDGTTLR
jgi:hypothetical protein